MVRLTSVGATVAHLLETLARSRVATRDMVLVDAQTLAPVEDATLARALAAGARAVDVALHPAHEFVPVAFCALAPASTATAATAAAPTTAPHRFHRSVAVRDLVAAAVPLLGLAQAPQQEAVVAACPDCDCVELDPATTLEQLCARVAGDGRAAVRLLVGPQSALVPTAVTVVRTGTGTDTGTGAGADGAAAPVVAARFAPAAPLAAVLRHALRETAGRADGLADMEVLDAAGARVADPGAVTLAAVAAALGPLPLADGQTAYAFVLRDCEVLTLCYRPAPTATEAGAPGDAAEGVRTCTLRLPPTGLTLEEVRQTGCAELALDPAHVFVSTSSGIALLDTSSEVDSYHVAEGLCLCDTADMLRVTVNENFAVGFTRSSAPTVDVLLATMGMPPSVFVCVDDVIVPSDTPLVPDGSYSIVELPSDDFRTVPLVLDAPPATAAAASAAGAPPPRTITIDAFVECTVATLLRAAEQRVPDVFRAPHHPPAALPVLTDATGCVLDFALPIYMVPADALPLALAFF